MKRKYLNAGAFILSLFSLLASCTPQLPSPTGYAIVMGIENYPGEENDLTYTVDDAQSVRSLLEAKGYTVSALLIDADATRSTLDDEIGSIASAIGKDETFILYFSGHGGYTSLLPGEEPQDRTSENEYIVLLGGEEPPVADYLTDDELKSLIAEIPSQKKLIILDSCNSGGFIGSSGSFDAVSQDVYDEYGYDLLQSWYPAKAVALSFSYPSSQADITAGEAFVLSASGEEEESIETDGYGHGVFTYYLLEGAYRGDTNNDGYITVLELYNYIFGKLQALTFRFPDNSTEAFLPHVSGSPLDFVLFD